MALNLVAASSQNIRNGTPAISVMPFTVGAWAYSTTIAPGAAYIWWLGQSAAVNNFWGIGRTGSTWRLVGQNTTIQSGNAGTVVANQLAFVIARFINATNMRFTSMNAVTGVITHGQNITSVTPTANRMAVGALDGSSPTSFWDGGVSELWYTNTDIQADGLQLINDTVWKLAYGGPFSIPHIGASVIEYRSLRKHPSSDGDDPNEIFSSAGQQIWSNVGVATIGQHPPLPYWYVRPGQVIRNLVI